MRVRARTQIVFPSTFGCSRPPLVVSRDSQVDGINELVFVTGASVQAQDDKKLTPLHMAALKGHVKAIEALLKAGASVEAEDDSKDTPLHGAAFEGHVEAIKALVVAGASIEAEDYNKATPLHLAARMGHAEAIKALVAAGASVEASSATGKATPLHWAAHEGRTEAIKALVAAGALVEAETDQKATALRIAKKKGHTEAVAILEEVDPLMRWLKASGMSNTEHLPLLQALRVNRRADLQLLCGQTMEELFSSLAWSLSMSWLPTSLPCAPSCETVTGALYKAINGECAEREAAEMEDLVQAEPVEAKEEL